MKKENEKVAELEALLFRYGDPISIKKASDILKTKELDCRKILDKLQESLESEDRGLVIIRKEDKIQLATKPGLGKIGEKIAKEEFTEELTPATLETLTIVAYMSPVERTTIDFVRGVNSTYILRNLLMRGLIERDKSGHTYTYKITFDFLKHLGLKKIEELPEYKKYREIIENYETKT